MFLYEFECICIDICMNKYNSTLADISSIPTFLILTKPIMSSSSSEFASFMKSINATGHFFWKRHIFIIFICFIIRLNVSIIINIINIV